jgi:hypothetical protein
VLREREIHPENPLTPKNDQSAFFVRAFYHFGIETYTGGFAFGAETGVFICDGNFCIQQLRCDLLRIDLSSM